MMIKNALEFRNCGEAGQVSFQSNFWIVRVLKAIHKERDFISSTVSILVSVISFNM